MPDISKPCEKFIADRMLGRLAKWLRICGLDVSYSNKTEFWDLLKAHEDENRVIITRNTKIFEIRKRLDVVFIKHDRLHDQLGQFFRENEALDPFTNMLTRCIECNSVLEKIAKNKIKDKVWPYVYETQNDFNICPACSKIFWGGTHRNNMESTLLKWGRRPESGR